MKESNSIQSVKYMKSSILVKYGTFHIYKYSW